MILVSFCFSHRALSIGIDRDGIELKVTEIAQTNTPSAFNVLGYLVAYPFALMTARMRHGIDSTNVTSLEFEPTLPEYPHPIQGMGWVY